MFGPKCFRRNPHHFKEYAHAHLASLVVKFGREEPPVEATLGLEADRDVVLAQLKVLVDVCYEEEEPPPKKKIEKEEPKSKSPESAPKRKKMLSPLEKLEAAAPFNLFLTKVRM